MGYLIQIIAWISESMMLPVIILIVSLFFYSLFLLGAFFSLYMGLLKYHKKFGEILEDVNEKGEIDFSRFRNCEFISRLKELNEFGWNPLHCEKKIADYRLAHMKDLERSKFLVKIGPMLGLMGTLIPMGPALVGLANGDIASMAINMQIAFTTTVLGLFIGAVGFVTHSVKGRWYNEEIGNLQYILDIHLERKCDFESR